MMHYRRRFHEAQPKRRIAMRPFKPMGDAGNVTIEYALTLPILLAFIYGIMELSHFAYLKMTVSDVAHDAVRYAIVNSASSGSPATTTTVSTYAKNELTELGLTATPTVTVTFSPSNAAGSTAQVQISYPFVPFMPGFNTIPGTSNHFTDVVGPISGIAKMVFSA
jgi:Flp pilus assembly protein TadG